MVHRGKVVRGAIQANDRVKLVIDAGRREATRLSHSATHILHSALREVLRHAREASRFVSDT